MKNWYKKAKIEELYVLSHGGGTIKVVMNGKPYTFGPIDDDFARQLAWDIKNKPQEHGKIFNLLRKRYSFNNTPDHKEEEKQKMLDQLYDEGYLH